MTQEFIPGYAKENPQVLASVAYKVRSDYGLDPEQLMSAILEGKNTQEIAQELGVPEETAREAIKVLGYHW